MATYRQEIGTFTNTGTINNKTTCYLRCETSVDIVKNTTNIDYYLDREGYAYSDEIKFNITVNGSEEKYNQRHIYSEKELCVASNVINHNEDGTFGTVRIEFELFANYSNLLNVWLFHESCTLSFNTENIDRSTPDVQVIRTAADRFGKNVSISFSFEQWNDLSISSLAFTEAKLTLKGLDQFQAQNRSAQSLNADIVKTSFSNGLYNVTAIKTNNLKQNTEYTFYLDSADSQDIAPLTSGKTYEFEIAVTSENGNVGTLYGKLIIPQRITAFSCEDKIELVLGRTENIEYSIFPTNAEEQSVSFASSDTEIATISENGVITPIAEGSCKVSVIPDDDGSESFTYAVRHGGYYHTTNGEWIANSEVSSKSTGLIKVSVTDKFVYTGRGEHGIASVLWYSSDRSFISAEEYAGTIEGTAATKEIYPPEGAAYVKFQSFAYVGSIVELNVVRYAYGEAFKGECIVTVSLTQGFPELPENVQYLTAKLFTKINMAAEFVKDELTELGGVVEDFSDSSIIGNNHPVLQIREKLEATEENCQKLKAAADAQGFSTETLPISQSFEKANNNWYVIINNWILFLNDLHNQINGG